MFHVSAAQSVNKIVQVWSGFGEVRVKITEIPGLNRIPDRSRGPNRRPSQGGPLDTGAERQVRELEVDFLCFPIKFLGMLWWPMNGGGGRVVLASMAAALTVG